MAVTAPEASAVVTGGAPSPETQGTTPIPAPANPSPATDTATGAPPVSQEQPTPQGGTAQETTGADPEEEFWRRVSATDAREIQKRNRSVANLVGNMADRLANERLEARKALLQKEWETDYQTKLEAQQLRELRDTNPELYVQREKELEQRLEEQRTEAERVASRVEEQANQMRDQTDSAIRTWAQSLPDPVQEKLRQLGTIDEGNWADSRRVFMEKATELHKEYLRESVLKDELPKVLKSEVDKELAKRSRDIETGIKQAAAAEANASEPAVDTGGGGNPGVGPMTQEEFQAIRYDPALRKQHKDRIVAGVNAGLITR